MSIKKCEKNQDSVITFRQKVLIGSGITAFAVALLLGGAAAASHYYLGLGVVGASATGSAALIPLSLGMGLFILSVRTTRTSLYTTEVSTQEAEEEQTSVSKHSSSAKETSAKETSAEETSAEETSAEEDTETSSSTRPSSKEEASGKNDPSFLSEKFVKWIKKGNLTSLEEAYKADKSWLHKKEKEEDYTPLLLAICEQQTQIVDTFLKWDPTVFNVITKKGVDPLFAAMAYAVYYQESVSAKEIFEKILNFKSSLLVEKKNRFDLIDVTVLEALMYEKEIQPKEILSFLQLNQDFIQETCGEEGVQELERINSLLVDVDSLFSQKRKQVIISRLIQKGDLKTLRTEFAKDLLWINQQHFLYKTTPLDEAISYGQHEIVETLLQWGANPALSIPGAYNHLYAAVIRIQEADLQNRINIFKSILKSNLDLLLYDKSESNLNCLMLFDLYESLDRIFAMSKKSRSIGAILDILKEIENGIPHEKREVIAECKNECGKTWKTLKEELEGKRKKEQKTKKLTYRPKHKWKK